MPYENAGKERIEATSRSIRVSPGIWAVKGVCSLKGRRGREIEQAAGIPQSRWEGRKGGGAHFYILPSSPVEPGPATPLHPFQDIIGVSHIVQSQDPGSGAPPAPTSYKHSYTHTCTHTYL